MAVFYTCLSGTNLNAFEKITYQWILLNACLYFQEAQIIKKNYLSASKTVSLRVPPSQGGTNKNKFLLPENLGGTQFECLQRK